MTTVFLRKTTILISLEYNRYSEFDILKIRKHCENFNTNMTHEYLDCSVFTYAQE